MPLWLITLLAKVLEPVISQALKNLGLYFDNKKIDKQAEAVSTALDESQKAQSEEDRKRAIRDLAASIND